MPIPNGNLFDENGIIKNEYLDLSDKADKTYVDDELDKKVDKVTGKSLVDDTEIEKLEALPTNSQLNNLLDDKLDKITYEARGSIIDAGTSFSLNDIQLNNYNTFYKCTFTGNTVYDLDIVTTLLSLNDKNYRFELIVELDGGSVVPTFRLYILDSVSGVLTFLIPPVIEHPHTINKFVFETFDGGYTWYANQCYSVEVTD